MTEADFPHVVEWLAQPHVHRWWHLAYDLPAATEKYGPRLRGEEPTHMLIVESGALPVGFAQWYRWDDYADDRGNYRIGAGELGFDYAIGDAAQCGRGVGTIMIARLLDLLRTEAASGTAVTVTPEAANAASRRILEKNGFAQTPRDVRDRAARRSRARGSDSVYRAPLPNRRLVRPGRPGAKCARTEGRVTKYTSPASTSACTNCSTRIHAGYGVICTTISATIPRQPSRMTRR